MNKLPLHRNLALGLCLALALCAVPALAENWTQFRGTNSAGVGQSTTLPATWDTNTNIAWKTKLPGLGTSSPIVLDGRIYLTSYSGYAESIDNPGDVKNLMRHVVCLNRASGDVIWIKDFTPKQPESEYKGGNSSRHGYASSTLTTDGNRLYAFFGISGAFGLDLNGNTLWQVDLGDGTHNWGSATSPILYKNLLVVNAGVESETLYGINKDTGEIVWKTGGMNRCWSSPVLVKVGDGHELVLNMPNKITGFNPETGKELWHCEGIPDNYVCPSVVAEDGVVYAIGGRKNTSIAVRAGGTGDVTASHVLWRMEKGSNVTSPVLVDGHLYWLHESRGVAYCLNAKTGEVVYEEKLEPKPGLIYSSITVADGKLYSASQDNGTYVFAAKPEFEQLAVNTFADDTSRVNACVVVHDNQMLLRTDQAVYCIGPAAKTAAAE